MAPPSKALSLTDDNLSGWPRTYDDALSNEGIRSKWAMLVDSVLDAEGKAQAEEIVVSVEAWMTLASS